ncbi:MAG: Uncharacterised protein [Hyphomonas sp. TMED17]|nr:MAG: Uncharacterised protein [Hyphomonas sp. TMED17]
MNFQAKYDFPIAAIAFQRVCWTFFHDLTTPIPNIIHPSQSRRAGLWLPRHALDVLSCAGLYHDRLI